MTRLKATSHNDSYSKIRLMGIGIYGRGWRTWLWRYITAWLVWSSMYSPIVVHKQIREQNDFSQNSWSATLLTLSTIYRAVAPAIHWELVTEIKRHSPGKKHELIHCKTFKILQFCSCHQLVLFAVVLQRGLTEIERFITRWYEKSCRFNYIRLVRLQNHSFIHQITVSAICKNAKFICVYIFIDVNGSEWKCSTAKCL